MTERERMLAGELYDPFDPDLVQSRERARALTRAFNETGDASLLRELLGGVGDRVEVVPPFACDYGTYVELGDRVFMNMNCVVLDCAPVTVGAGTLVGPAVHFYAATHPTDPAVRRTGRECARPIRVGENVWIGGGAIIGAGVSIGDDTTIGAGSVVVKDIPANVVAVGNPCRVVREL